MNEQTTPLVIADLGFDAYVERTGLDRSAYPAERIGRVVEEYRTRWVLASNSGPLDASVRGSVHYDLDAEAFPKVGDWVLFTALSGGKATIEEILPRTVIVARKNIHGKGRQVIVTNIDTVAIVQAADQELNLPKLNRYLSLVRESGARPVFVFTKADLLSDVEPLTRALSESAPDVPQVVISSRTGAGLDALLHYFTPRTTSVLLGSSGAGKSTLLNALIQSEVQATHAVRATDGTGRHTTTMRSLFVLPSGALLIDTPGMRELTAASDLDDKKDTFDDVAEIAYGCRYPNCDHEKSGGCAVLTALAEKSLDEKRYRAYLKFLVREKKAAVRTDGNQHSDRVKSNRAMLNYESRRQSEEE